MITDWKGNEIKPGMEVCIIKVIDRNTIISDAECWEPFKCYKLNERLHFFTDIGNGFTLSQPIEMLTFRLNKETHILAIKGISDNREDYERTMHPI